MDLVSFGLAQRKTGVKYSEAANVQHTLSLFPAFATTLPAINVRISLELPVTAREAEDTFATLRLPDRTTPIGPHYPGHVDTAEWLSRWDRRLLSTPLGPFTFPRASPSCAPLKIAEGIMQSSKNFCNAYTQPLPDALVKGLLKLVVPCLRSSNVEITAIYNLHFPLFKRSFSQFRFVFRSLPKHLNLQLLSKELSSWIIRAMRVLLPHALLLGLR
ncbi:hypothetical protein Hypma_008961 [Hypsizygus marmoreus]|uniref:Uncharacterized protein n=1 Tax=Hypsizygus marmoreus TaxID=39966 RepID=A0A369JRF6_HYPMA|nr:hypothetical protein Hypma_008961 [Hypsizygus marmoreus]